MRFAVVWDKIKFTAVTICEHWFYYSRVSLIQRKVSSYTGASGPQWGTPTAALETAQSSEAGKLGQEAAAARRRKQTQTPNSTQRMTFTVVWNQVRLIYGDETVLETHRQPRDLYLTLSAQRSGQFVSAAASLFLMIHSPNK